MAHAVANLAPLTPYSPPSLRRKPPPSSASPPPLLTHFRRRRIRLSLTSTASPVGLLSVRAFAGAPSMPVEADPREALERCLGAPCANPEASPSSSASVSAPQMKGEYGSFGAVTLEKSKLDLSQKTTKSSPQIATGGGGGDIGKKNFHGGGDGGDDGGDDDDYMGDFEDGDEGDDDGLFRRRIVIQELFDRKFVDAVLEEWFKTMADLPPGLRQAYELGLVSSAQIVRFLTVHARPTFARALSRALPAWLSRAFNGRIKKEYDLALINVLTATICNGIIVWSLAPCRPFGNTFRFDFQNTLYKLPNNIFEKSYPLREFDLQKRSLSFVVNGVQLFLVGLLTGGVQGVLSKVSSKQKNERLSVTIPSMLTNTLGYGAFLGLHANLRYQLISGIDRAVINYFDVMGVAMFITMALRMLNVQVGETSKMALLGVGPDPLVQSDNVLKAYNRPSDTEMEARSDSKWFISKDAIVSGLGLFGAKQASEDSKAAPPPKARRKRIVTKKVSTASS
ncbi:hypothetical protein QJS04_geneDACA020820 [Acorus gramineus]|uniref:Protein RETICULATA-RELATED 1, chloroplastic n=1 Tax=Acorus gramineus TaxID=55184 RepID=A0AAV9BG16_ACOGR|nr:hypothetical protein QJS04_geneDACA020820 [Acorus gramineus]